MMAGGADEPGSKPPSVRQELKSVVARWVLQRRSRRAGSAWRPGPADEGTHPWDGRRHFAEDYAFAGVQRDAAVLLRLEWLPGRQAQRVWVALLRPEGAYVLPGMLRGSQGLVRSASRRPWQGGGLALDCVTPQQQWKVAFDGALEHATKAGPPLRCRAELTFRARDAPFVPVSDDDPDNLAQQLGSLTWDHRLLRTLRRRSNRGYVQLGTIEGTLVLQDALIPIRASAAREHAWGVRDWGASDRAARCLMTAADGPWLWLHHAEFPWMTLSGGFSLYGSHRELVRRLEVRSRKDASGRLTAVSYGLQHAGHFSGPMHVSARVQSEVTFEVDGRGRVTLALLRTEQPEGWGLWVEQRRVLPRPPVGG